MKRETKIVFNLNIPSPMIMSISRCIIVVVVYIYIYNEYMRTWDISRFVYTRTLTHTRVRTMYVVHTCVEDNMCVLVCGIFQGDSQGRVDQVHNEITNIYRVT